jgi:hypothetical protein
MLEIECRNDREVSLSAPSIEKDSLGMGLFLEYVESV